MNRLDPSRAGDGAFAARAASMAPWALVAVILALAAWLFPSAWHADLQGGVVDRLGGWSGVDLFRLGLGALAVYAVVLGLLWPQALGEAAASSSTTRADPGRMSRRSALAWVVGITAVGALIRSWGLDGSFWLDELYTRNMAVDEHWLENLTTFRTTNNHIAHTLLTTMWISVFGEHEWAVRITAFTFGVGGIFAVYGLSRRVAPREVAVWSSALCAVTYHHVMFSQNARGYTAQLFFFTLACGFLHDALRRGATRDWVRFVVCSWISLWFVFLAGFTFVAHGLIALSWTLWGLSRGRHGGRRLGRAAFAFVGLALLSFQSYALMVPSIVRVLARDYGKEDGGGLHILSVNFLRDLAAGFGLSLTQAAIVGALALGVGVWVGMGVVRRHPLMVMLLLSPSAIVVVFALLTGLDVYPRFFLSLMIGFFVLLAEMGCRLGGAWMANRPATRHPLWTGWPLTAVLLVFVLVLPRVVGVPKQPYEEALTWAWRALQETDGGSSARIRERSQDQPSIFCLAHVSSGCRYYAPRLGIPARSTVLDPTAADLTRVRAAGHDVVAVTTLHRLSARRRPDVFEELHSHWRPVRRFRGTIGDGDVVVWRAARDL